MIEDALPRPRRTCRTRPRTPSAKAPRRRSLTTSPRRPLPRTPSTGPGRPSRRSILAPRSTPLSVQIITPFPAGTTILNSVTVAASEAGAGDTIVTQLKAADLSLSKAVTSTPTYLGQNATFRLTVTNAGPDAAGGVQVLDALPVGATFVSSTPSQGSYVSGTGVWAVGTIPSGASATLDITATVVALSVTNTAQVSASDAADPDSTPANSVGGEDDQASATVNVLPRAECR